MTRARLAVGVALICAGAVAAAIVLAWPPAMEKVTPIAADSFDRSTVAEGADLARLGNCAGCHTSDPSRPLAGGRGLKTPFGTVFVSNITPNVEDGIGGWSREAFGRALRRGIARDGTHLYPAFPYDHYTHVTDRQLDSLYAWLMTRRPVAGRAPETKLDGIAGWRPVMAGWNMMRLREGPIADDLSQTPQWNRGRALVAGLAHCGSCHTPRDQLGAEDGARLFDGAEIDGWYAPPLNARSPAVRPWTADALYTYLRTGLSPQHAAAAGPMGDVTRALSEAPEDDVRAIAVYIASLMETAPAAQQDKAEPIDRAAEAARAYPEAATLFGGACAGCHETGAPMVQLGRPPLSWGTPLHLDTPSSTIAIIAQGLTSPAGPTGPTMPAYADLLDERQIKELAAYLRVRFTDKPAWPDSATTVAQNRPGEAGERK